MALRDLITLGLGPEIVAPSSLTVQDILDGMNATPPAVNVTLWKGDTPGDLDEDGNVPTTGGGGTPTGTGAVSWPMTIDDGTNPVDGAEVWVTTDLAGTNVVAGTLSTDAMGLVTFMLDAGDYYAWVQASGTNFVNPTAFTVTA